MRNGAISILVFSVLVLCGLLWAPGTVRAQNPAPPNVDLKIERVALFKNGLGFFISGATLPADARTVRIGQIPVPSLGTFWVSYPKEVKLRNLVTAMEEYEESTPIDGIAQLIQANPGCKVVLYTGPTGADVVEGTVQAIPPKMKVPQPVSPYAMSSFLPREGEQFPVSSSGLLLVKTEKGTVGVNPGSIQRVYLDKSDAATTLPVKQKRPCIRAEFEQPAGGQKLSVSYLAKGITWSPSYLVDLSDPQTAKLSATALVVNEAADLDKVKLDLVTGFPNIKFGELPNPIAMRQSLADFLNVLTNPRSESERNHGMMTQQAVFSNSITHLYSDAGGGAQPPSYSLPTEGTVSEDLFLYPVAELTLKKGETAMIPLFTGDMPYRHIYAWKVGDSLDENERNRPETQPGSQPVPQEEVWHFCRLTNNLKMPLTTAATEFIKGGDLVGQDVCYYTPVGSTTDIRINRAMNVTAEQTEVELERARAVQSFNNLMYDQVKMRGEMKLKSNIDKPITIEVTKELSGEVVEKSPEGQDTPTAKGLKAVNPRHILKWTLELKPGEEAKITYVYKAYIHM